MVRSITAFPVKVSVPEATFSKKVIERWGTQGGDSTEYHISVTGDRARMYGHGKVDLSVSRELLVELAQAILIVVAAQSGETG